MTDSIEALIVLSKAGTMASAANQLRITPSAISKRIAHLEEATGYAVIEKEGRLVKLTPAGLKLVERTEPLLADLRFALKDQPDAVSGELTIGVSESVLSSWGAKLLVSAAQRTPGIVLKLGAHRSPVVAQRVLSGEYALGLCAGASLRSPDLAVEYLGEETLVLVPSELKPLTLRAGKTFDILTIEPHAATWESLKSQLRRLASERDIELRVKETLQSFAAVVQLAKAGYAHGLVPEGVATSMGVPKAKQIHLPSPGLSRPISLIARPTTFSRTLVRRFTEATQDLALRTLSKK